MNCANTNINQNTTKIDDIDAIIEETLQEDPPHDIDEIMQWVYGEDVFTTGGGMGQEAMVVVKKLADDLAMKRNERYSRVVSWMRCRLAFSLARAAIRCVHGSRSIHRWMHHQAPVDLVLAEARMEQV